MASQAKSTSGIGSTTTPAAIGGDYNIAIKQRNSPPNWVQTIIFGIFFNLSIILLNSAQFIAASILYPFEAGRPYLEKAIAYTKLGFGRLLIAITQLFGPTKIILSFTDENGTPLDPEQFITRHPTKRGEDGKGKIIGVKLPERSVWIANHQIYLDWLYLWCVAYYAKLADSIYIILKASLKWVPIVGWGMQFYRFIFLKRNWNADKDYLGKHLSFLADRSQSKGKHDKKLQDGDLAAAKAAPSRLLLLIFPEGTLVSENTRPDSAKFAAKMGYKDLRNMVLPRSTGLFFCLRALASEIDDLHLVDYTIGYPGVPPQGYGQDYYTLRSVYMQGVPPPAVHLNVIINKVTSPSDPPEVDPSTVDKSRPPLGKLPPSGKASGADEFAPTDAEKAAFDQWLRDRWSKKDQFMDKFYEEGDFVSGAFTKKQNSGAASSDSSHFVEIPVRLLSPTEFGDLFAWGLPAVFVYAVKKLIRLF